MDCVKLTTYSITDLTEHEMSAIEAGLILLANGAEKPDGSHYPEYKRTAGSMLGKLSMTESATAGTANK